MSLGHFHHNQNGSSFINFVFKSFLCDFQGDRDVETFDVELVKDSRGLGITIAGYVEQSSGLFELLKLSNIMADLLYVYFSFVSAVILM